MLPTVFVTTWKEIGLSWFQRLVNYRQKLLPTNYKLIGESDKSFADDLVASRYCKHESILCDTICWDSSCVPTICSSLLPIAKRPQTLRRLGFFLCTFFYLTTRSTIPVLDGNYASTRPVGLKRRVVSPPVSFFTKVTQLFGGRKVLVDCTWTGSLL